MNWNFIKTNWFSIALVVLVLAAILRKNNNVPFFTPSTEQGDKIAGLPDLRNASTALGLGMEKPHPSAPAEIDQATAEKFLKRFAKVAVSEKKKFGVPASVLLAVSFLNSNIGAGPAATEANNLFAVPCTDDWEGETASFNGKCFRKYETAWASWRDFNIYLAGQNWFGALKQSAGKDWQKWVAALDDKNISKVDRFDAKLKQVIEQYRLYELDQQ